MVRVINSAMMPKEGMYIMKRITKKEFCDRLKAAYEKNELQSYIGYQDNLRLIAEWTGIILPFCRENTIVNDNDELLIMKLKYRMGDPSMKGKLSFGEDDFEFFRAKYIDFGFRRLQKRGKRRL